VLSRLLAVALLCSAPLAMAQAPLHQIDPLPKKGQLVPIFASAMNQRGEVAGLAHDRSADHETFGYRYAGGVLTRLPNSREVEVRAMNRDGDVIGQMSIKTSGTRRNHVIIWHADGTREDLGDLGEPRDINAADQVVGVRIVGGRIRAYLHERGVTTDLGDFGRGGDTWAHAINDAGWVVGSVREDDGVEHAFLLKDGVMHDLGTLGGTFSQARGINAQGHVVGFSTDASGVQKAFLHDGTAMRALPPPVGGREFIAYAINGHDEVVGCDSWNQPVLWRGGQSHRLQELLADGAELWDNVYCSIGSNDAGQMAGNGTYQPNVRAKSRPYLATPLTGEWAMP
jgi:probable HAF family extracellular repeat protein